MDASQGGVGICAYNPSTWEAGGILGVPAQFRIQSKTLFQKQTKPKISFLVLLNLHLKFFIVVFKIWTFVCFTCVDWPGKSKERLRSLGNGLNIHVGAGNPFPIFWSSSQYFKILNHRSNSKIFPHLSHDPPFLLKKTKLP